MGGTARPSLIPWSLSSCLRVRSRERSRLASYRSRQSIPVKSCSNSRPVKPARDKQNGSRSTNGNGSSNGQPRLRDRLCLLIRQHQLDSNLVKRYAAEFCGTEELREASRDMVEAFIDHLSKWAIEDHAGLLSKLNGYSQVQEVGP